MVIIMIKYLILDFGKVLAYPTTGEWFITPCFEKLIDMDKINKNDVLKSISNYNDIISRKAITLEEEYQMFFELYQNIFRDIGYEVSDEIIHSIAHNFTYEDDKYGFYDNVEEELQYLSGKYKLILLSDNWPCAFPIMKKRGLDKYFEKMYISSIYGTKKEYGDFFDYPIKDFNIEPSEAIFVDDNEKLLDVAIKKGFNVRLMDRENTEFSKYNKINNLFEL